MMSSETGTIFYGKTIYATYKNISGVKADFGVTSKTYQLATAFFGTSPNPIGSGGSPIIGHWRKTDLTLPAVEFDTLTGSEIDSNELLKTLRQIEDGSMTLGELTLENLNFGDSVTFGDMINTLNRALPDGVTRLMTISQTTAMCLQTENQPSATKTSIWWYLEKD